MGIHERGEQEYKGRVDDARFFEGCLEETNFISVSLPFTFFFGFRVA